MCCDGWYHSDEEINDECPDCGTPVVRDEETGEMEAQSGCNWSPEVCETCGWAPCDLSC